MDLWKDYDDQYLMIEARISTGQGSSILTQEKDLEDIIQDVTCFSQNISRKFNEWNQHLSEIKKKGKRTVIWGAGSKGVAFLTTLKIQDEVSYAVDINPHKQGSYMAGSGHRIIGPEFLRKYRPDVVIVMNSIYRNEVQKKLEEMEITADIIPV
jgi:FlaA1/EpsC-like NDP-sugar epimerase